MYSAMAKIYAKLIKAGKHRIEDVPCRYVQEVQNILKKENNND